MKKMLSTIAALALVGMTTATTTALADCGGCGTEKAHTTGNADKAAACPASTGACADKAASADCATKCAAKEASGMVKGGAADSTTTTGYGLGQTVPDFTLSEASGTSHSLSSFGDKIKVVVFYNQNCPYVVEVKDRLSAFAKEYADKGVVTVAVDSSYNNATESIAEHAKTVSYPILVNNESDLAVKFAAARTPEIFILDKTNKVVYTGMFDSGKEVDAEGNRKTPVKDAVEELLAGKEVTVKQTKAFGCTIKFNPKSQAGG